jgi:hypothetical protein
VRRDLLLIDDPVERICRAISRIGREIGGLDLETLLCPLDHCLSRTNLCLANGTASFDIHDDAELDVDEIIVRIGEESWPSQRAAAIAERGAGFRSQKTLGPIQRHRMAG